VQAVLAAWDMHLGHWLHVGGSVGELGTRKGGGRTLAVAQSPPPPPTAIAVAAQPSTRTSIMRPAAIT